MSHTTLKLKEIAENLDSKRKPLNNTTRNEMKSNPIYPYYGANGLFDYIDTYIFDDEILCIAEDGGSWGFKEKCTYIVRGKCWVNNHAHVLKIKENGDLRYLMYYLNYSDLTKYITGTTRGKLTKTALNRIEVKLPPLQTQKKIVKALDKAQELIDLRKKQIELLDELIQSVFYDMFGDPVTNPKGWEVKEFSKGMCEIKYGTSSPPKFSQYGIPFIRATNIKNGYIVKNGMKYIDKSESEKIEKCRLKRGDILIVRSGVNTGDATYITEEFANGFAGYDLIVRLNEKLNPIYVNILLMSNYRKVIINPLTRRAAQPHLNSKQVSMLRISIPPVKLQNEFAQKVKKIKQQKQLMQQSLTEMENNLGSQMQKAFKGELFN